MTTLQQKSAEIIRTLKEIWRLDYLNPEDLDPIILMMIGACAYESSRIEKLLEDNDKYIIDKLIDNILSYKYTLPIPAHALIECQTSEVNYEISDKINFKVDSEGESFNFIPLVNTNIINAKISYSIKGNKLYKHQKDKLEIKKNDLGNDPFLIENIWLGLEIDKDVKSINGLTLSLNFINDFLSTSGLDFILNRKRYTENYTLLIDDKEIKTEKLINIENLSFEEHQKSKESILYFNYFNDIRKEILNIYSDKIYRITNISGEIIKTSFPENYSKKFNININDTIKEKLVWVRIKLPRQFPSEILDSINISINCFPVINCLKSSLFLDKYYSIRQFSHKGSEKFLCITDYDVFNEETQTSLNNRFKDDYPFIIRDYGLKKYDDFEIINLLNEVYEKFKADYFALKKITGIDDQTIERLNDVLQAIYISRLSGITDKEIFPWAILHYDIIKNDNLLNKIKITVNYILTNGKNANFIKNSILKCDKSSVQFARFILKPADGKDVPDIKEKEYAIKYSLLSNDAGNDKIVTKEDIKSYCYYLLGDKINNLKVYNSVCIGEKKGMGIIRCINVDILLSNIIKIEDYELLYLQSFVKQKLEFRSSNVLPYKVKVCYA